jgi:hypothetical protein
MKGPADSPLLTRLLRLAGDSGAFAPSGPIDPDDVDWAIATAMGPLLWAATRECTDRITNEEAIHLRTAEATARIEHDERLEALDSILTETADEAPAPILLKGVSLSLVHHPAPHRRLMGDIDLLVSEAEADAIDEALAKAGYVLDTDPVPANHHHRVPRIHPETQVTFELHTGLFPPGSPLAQAEPFRPETVEAECEAADFRGHAVRHLGRELHLVYLASHWAADFRLEAGPRALLDARLLIGADGEQVDWERIARWLSAPRVAAHLQLLLSVLERQRIVDLPDAAHHALASHRPLGPFTLRALASLVERFMLAGVPANPVPLSIVWDTLLNDRAPSAWNWLRVPWNLVFPPHHPDRYRLSFQLDRLRAAARRAD